MMAVFLREAVEYQRLMCAEGLGDALVKTFKKSLKKPLTAVLIFDIMSAHTEEHRAKI